MKNILNFNSNKYGDSAYSLVEDGIYLFDNPPEVTFTAIERFFKLKGSCGYKYKYGPMLISKLEPKIYVTSLSFEQEPSLGEEKKPSYISQFPLEDILDKYRVYVSDFYTILNETSKKKCYQEFASKDLNNIKNLRKIIGKHVYSRVSKKTGNYSLVIE